MSYFLFESGCKGTTKNAHDQIFWKKNAIFLKKSAFFRKNRGHGLHFATVASGELVKHSADQGGVRRYNCVVKCEGVARIHDQIFLKKMQFFFILLQKSFFLLTSDTALAINTTTQYTSLIANSPVATFARRNPLVIRICFANWGWPRLLLFPQTHELCGSPIDWPYYRSLVIILQNRLIPSLIH